VVLTTSKEIIRQYGQNGPRIVAMTANVYTEDKIKCTEVGMVDFITKPIRVDNICRVLKRLSGDNAARIRDLDLSELALTPFSIIWQMKPEALSIEIGDNTFVKNNNQRPQYAYLR
jgi:DNA-binding response OmpR family regulator